MIYAHIMKINKPRIKRRHGLWVCAREGEWYTGTGNTPAEAYAYWYQSEKYGGYRPIVKSDSDHLAGSSNQLIPVLSA